MTIGETGDVGPRCGSNQKNVPSLSAVAANPARIIRAIKQDTTEEKGRTLHFWNSLRFISKVMGKFIAPIIGSRLCREPVS